MTSREPPLGCVRLVLDTSSGRRYLSVCRSACHCQRPDWIIFNPNRRMKHPLLGATETSTARKSTPFAFPNDEVVSGPSESPPASHSPPQNPSPAFSSPSGNRPLIGAGTHATVRSGAPRRPRGAQPWSQAQDRSLSARPQPRPRSTHGAEIKKCKKVPVPKSDTQISAPPPPQPPLFSVICPHPAREIKNCTMNLSPKSDTH